MARNKEVKSGGSAHVRMVLIDAVVPDGDVSQIMQAIQNALKPATIVQTPRLANGSTARTIAHDPQENAEQVDDVEEEVEEEDLFPARPAAPKKPRSTVRAPKAVPIEMHEDVSLATFAQGKDVGSQAKKYLVASAWLKEHRGIEAVGGGHIYTCFKAMDWSTSIPDFNQPLRDLKAKQQYYDKSDKGYEINHLGLDYVKKLGGKTNGAG